jgi:hypothetical protein
MKLPRFRSLFRFSVRTLLLIVTAVAVWLGLHVHKTRVQQQSVKAVREYGGWVRYDFQFPSGKFSHKDFDPKAESNVPQWLLDRLGIDFFHSVVQVNLNYSEDSGAREENDNPSDEALQYLPGLPNLRVLLLSDTQASDASMRHLASLKRLEQLFMWDVRNVTDAGAAHLGKLRNLRYIHLSTSQITDESLRVFAGMPNLDGLSLQFNYFTDEGVKRISQLKRLESLWVCGRRDRANPITDAGLKELEKLRNLTELGIQHTQVTGKGIESFEKAVPNCRVVH